MLTAGPAAARPPTFPSEAQLAATPAQLAWPLNRAEALQQLDAFVEKALPHFGDFQDADEPSRLANVSLAPVF